MRFAFVDIMRQHKTAVAILVAYLILGMTYSVVTPLLETPDEMWHYPYVKHIADGRGLPVQPTSGGKGEYHQPPLYYALGAAVTFWLDTSDYPDLWRRNPFWGYPARGIDNDNKNLFFHTPAEGFPYRGAVLAMHLVRLLSVLMGVVTVLCTYLIALEILPGWEVLAVGAMALNAFNPQFLFISGSINNDNLVAALASLATLLAVGIVQGRASWRRLALLGLVIGLAWLSKWSALALLPLGLLALAVWAWRRRSASDFLRGSAPVLGLALAVSGWWFIRNLGLYGDPLGMSAYLQIWKPRAPRPGLSDLVAEFPEKEVSLWAAFGWGNIRADPFVYQMLALMVRLSLLGLVIFLLRRCRGLEASIRWALLMLALWFAFIFASFVQWMRLTEAAWARHLFPAISAISILLFLGLLQLVPRRFEEALAGCIGGGMLILALVTPFRYIAPAYAKPPTLSAAAIQAIPHRLDINYGGKMRLLGYELDKEAVRPGETLSVTLYWQSLAAMERDYSVFVHLFGRDDQPIGARDTYPGLGSYPTSLWPVGEVIRDTYKVPVDPEAAAPSLGRVEAGLYDLTSRENLPTYDREMRPLGTSPLIARFKIAAAKLQEFVIPNPVRFDLGGKVALIGYELDENSLRPGETLRLTLYWQALSEMEEDYTVFVHLIDEENKLWGQGDSQPQGGQYPTSIWTISEVIEDEYELTVAPDTSPGGYQLEVGMYLLSTGERLLVRDREGWSQGDRILLGPVEVTED